ncbi:uncharacterized protein LOC112200534 isoform X2 [Rosa chinensis]|uniref:uncharacterized protein LOC112200534 isoform X2 n=1 Tax=Rosa chinensis TaxID=74649 RepID=UPI001AD8D4B6|nr:uncharacterized protein LOC112200534 isoform X2 [Rosa chinensis]
MVGIIKATLLFILLQGVAIFSSISVMALTKTQLLVLAAALIYISLSCCKMGSADEDGPETGNVPQTGGAGEFDPAQIVAKALLCFNNNYVYSSCEQSFRLNESGDLKVPKDKTDEFCNGACLTETHLVLNCVDHILANFVFYNKATIRDVRDTVQAGCGSGPERGNFNVEEHMAETSKARTPATYQILVGLVLMVLGNGLLF